MTVSYPYERRTKAPVARILLAIALIVGIFWWIQTANAWASRGCDDTWLMPFVHGSPSSTEYCEDL